MVSDAKLIYECELLLCMFANKHECECLTYMIVDTFGYDFRPHIVDSDMLFHVPKPFWKGHHHFGVMIWIFVLRL